MTLSENHGWKPTKFWRLCTPRSVVDDVLVNIDQTDVGISRTKNFSVQVTTIWLTKENYLQWSAAITMGIAGRGRIAYVNEKKVEPVATSAAWDTWFLEDNQTLFGSSSRPPLSPLQGKHPPFSPLLVAVQQSSVAIAVTGCRSFSEETEAEKEN
ncbi:hypothetical protein EJ110_NYTH48007 [Nymphaea thermarum]|nr:hypothetical protein EJ110_NYTH48007 [Nymphaea thermarum]